VKRDCNLKDVEYVKKLLAGDYPTEKTKEIPYPSFQELISSTSFDYLNGTVEGEVPNGPRSREGHPYLWFRHIDKSILSHRFIASVTLEKWIPRDCDVDHINHNPSDNRPSNLRIVTKRDNAGNRRKALLSDLADIDQVAKALAELKASLEVNQEHQRDPAPNIDATDELFWPSTGSPVYPRTTQEGPSQVRPAEPFSRLSKAAGTSIQMVKHLMPTTLNWKTFHGDPEGDLRWSSGCSYSDQAPSKHLWSNLSEHFADVHCWWT
jgi:hypothetical protein